MPTKSMFEILEELDELRKEKQFLNAELDFQKQRNKELRQKSWFQVYEENLKLTELLKVREDQLKQSAEISDNFYCQMIEKQKENRHLKEVLTSVETFVNQFTK